LNHPYSVFVSGNYAYVAAQGDNSLTIIDVTNPAAPTFKGHIAGVGAPNYLSGPSSVFVSGNYAYVAAQGDNSLTIIDVTNPAAPTFKGHIAGTAAPNYLNNPYSVFVSGNYAYVAAYDDNSLTIIDVSWLTSGATPPSVNLNTIADNSWVFSVAQGGGGSVVTGNTQRWNVLESNAGIYSPGAGSDTNAPVHPAGSQTMSWTQNIIGPWAISAASFAPLLSAAARSGGNNASKLMAMGLI
jgi:rhodanese-related sulfurtransferase